jgi:hypothetical protein
MATADARLKNARTNASLFSGAAKFGGSLTPDRNDNVTCVNASCPWFGIFSAHITLPERQE